MSKSARRSKRKNIVNNAQVRTPLMIIMYVLIFPPISLEKISSQKRSWEPNILGEFSNM